MREIKEKIAYLHGLSEGLNVGRETKEGRVLNGIIDVLDQFADVLEDMENAQVELEDYVESIDEDLYDLEDEIYEEDIVETNPDSDYIEVECPKCEETVCFESDILADDDYIEVTCPNCDEVVFTNDDTIENIHDEIYENTSNNDILENDDTPRILRGSIKNHKITDI